MRCILSTVLAISLTGAVTTFAGRYQTVAIRGPKPAKPKSHDRVSITLTRRSNGKTSYKGNLALGMRVAESLPSPSRLYLLLPGLRTLAVSSAAASQPTRLLVRATKEDRHFASGASSLDLRFSGDIALVEEFHYVPKAGLTAKSVASLLRHNPSFPDASRLAQLVESRGARAIDLESHGVALDITPLNNTTAEVRIVSTRIADGQPYKVKTIAGDEYEIQLYSGFESEIN